HLLDIEPARSRCPRSSQCCSLNARETLYTKGTSMTLDALGPIDTGFLDIEDDVNQMHIGAVLILEGPPPPAAALRDMVAAKLASVPRYRQVVRRVAFDATRPVWAD